MAKIPPIVVPVSRDAQILEILREIRDELHRANEHRDEVGESLGGELAERLRIAPDKKRAVYK